MKKFLLYIIAFITIIFIIPIVLTNNKNIKKEVSTNVMLPEEEYVKINNNENEEIPESKNNTIKTIKLLKTKTGEIKEMNLNEYLYRVVSAEMPATFSIEALKAQVIVARTYTLYKSQGKQHQNADICDSYNCCQAYISKEDRLAKWDENVRQYNWDKITYAVNSTENNIIKYEGNPIAAFFHSNSGGTTEIPLNVWGGTGYPYLQAVTTSGEEGYSQYSSSVILNQQELLEKLKVKYKDIQINFENLEDIKVIEYTQGNRVKTIKFGNKNISGVEIRTLLGLKSANFQIKKEGQNYVFYVLGYGHGVGMSQTGADSLAKQGYDFKYIIHHFYKGVSISNF